MSRESHYDAGGNRSGYSREGKGGRTHHYDAGGRRSGSSRPGKLVGRRAEP